MLVEIKDDIFAKELLEKGIAEEASPLISYYKDELRCQLEVLSVNHNLSDNDIDTIIEELSYGWSDIIFDDVSEQIYLLAEEYLEEKVR